MELILGSQSPRRRELLERMGLGFRVLTAEIDETKYETEDPETSVRRICQAKAAAVADRLRSLPEGQRCKERIVTVGGFDEYLCLPQRGGIFLGAVDGGAPFGSLCGQIPSEGEALAVESGSHKREH